jgi:ribonuclease BN (tRNA processing enzyme)
VRRSRSRLRAVGLWVCLLWASDRADAQNPCRTAALGVQVLGSGGPFAGTERASTSYLVWVNGRAAAMVDAGGGAFVRFGESGALLESLSLVAVSHLHADHVADLPALLWRSETARKEPLPIAGPSGNTAFPGLSVFLKRLFDGATGAFQVLSGTVGGPGSGVPLVVTELDATRTTPVSVLSAGGLRVTALPVAHGNVPAIAYRVEVGNRAIVFSSDQNGKTAGFADFASDADVLVMHLVLSPLAPVAQQGLHALPRTVGEMATAAKARKLVLGHFARPSRFEAPPDAFSLSDLPASVREVSATYKGPVIVSKDLECITIP